MAWQTPVYDRTNEDVEEAKYLINKINNEGYSSLNVEEKAKWDSGTLKGCRNYIDLNRIGNNCAYLGSVIGVTLPHTPKTDWDQQTTPLQTDIQNICDNVSALKTYLDGIITVPMPDIPVLPINSFYKLNDIEYILFLIYDTYNKLMRWSDLDDIQETWDELDAKGIVWQDAYLLSE